MEFRIADTFTGSLAKLTAQEQKAVKITVFELQTNRESSGLRLHKLEKTRDPNFWSVSVNMDIRIIVHKTDASMLLCYVDHHDKAYEWVQRRKIETHPNTGAAQLVEIRETFQEITVPKYTEVTNSVLRKTPLFSNKSDEELLGFGVPPEWLADVKNVNDEDLLLELCDHLPGEAAEALLDLAVGKKPQLISVSVGGADPFEHPDAKRRFRIVHNIEELKQALDFPLDKWSVFLHPQQREFVEREFNGAARVSGSAGTGKTIVALHRAVYLAKKYHDTRVLLTTFSEPLANALRNKLKVLLKHSPRIAERLEIDPIYELGMRLYKSNVGKCIIPKDSDLRKLIEDAAQENPGHGLKKRFLFSEWTQVVDAWQLNTWEEYRDVARLGRKTRLPENRRKILWDIFENVRKKLKEKTWVTQSEMFVKLGNILSAKKNPVYDFIIVDESQDIDIPQLRFLALAAAKRPNALFFAGDLGQRIFQQPFSWKSLGVDIRGRSKTLKVNYRTSHQIRSFADKLLGPEISDVDGNTEERKGVVSVFNGPKPEVTVLPSIDAEIDNVADWLQERINENLSPHELAVFVRSEAELDRAKQAVEKAGQSVNNLTNVVELVQEKISIGTMHLAKGLEFKGVAVIACDDEIVPLQQRIESVGDDADLEEIYNTERHLLYVACTRARDHLLITGVEPCSEFLDDLKNEINGKFVL
ncbi:MAG: UvrD-helicase domain-containing protein [Chitinispirillales bacterium]|jgi:superfamily I DNA/RNA helicase/mRNA-degrading endonuclease RelE of RelBE toxin-antitoxin system|nr:UvrD-helicase domain-containing protein [Chitinispirillales bacterium]